MINDKEDLVIGVVIYAMSILAMTGMFGIMLYKALEM